MAYHRHVALLRRSGSAAAGSLSPARGYTSTGAGTAVAFATAGGGGTTAAVPQSGQVNVWPTCSMVPYIRVRQIGQITGMYVAWPAGGGRAFLAERRFFTANRRPRRPGHVEHQLAVGTAALLARQKRRDLQRCQTPWASQSQRRLVVRRHVSWSFSSFHPTSPYRPSLPIAAR